MRAVHAETTARRHRARLIALAVLAALAVAVAPASAPAHALSLPTCGAKLSYGVNPHPNCYWPRFVSDTYVSTVTAKARVTKLTKLPLGVYRFTVAVTYGNTLASICPAGGIPYSAIPCRDAGVSIGFVGRSVQGAKSLATTSIGETDIRQCGGGVVGSCCPNDGTCTLHFQLQSSTDYGRLVLVLRVMQGEVTKNPANDLGQTGAEVPLVLTVPQYKG